VDSFSDGLAAVCEGKCAGNKREGKIGFINASGAYVIPPTFSLAGPFSEGLAAVTMDRDGPYHWGYIDRSGKVVLPPNWLAAGPFRQGLAGTLSGYIDAQGKVVIALDVARGGHVGDFSDGLALVSVGDDSTYYDAQGKVALKTKDAQPFSEGMAAAADSPLSASSKWGFIDKTGKVAIKFQWGMVGPFSGNLAAACQACRPTE
jgi:hypothetical protein